MKSKIRPPVPERFQVARPTLLFDRFMTHFIKVGGVAIIAAVFLIFVFIFMQAVPLFRGADVEAVRTMQVPVEDIKVFGSDEWSELPFFVDKSGGFHFLDTLDPGGPFNRGLFEASADLPIGLEYSVIRYNERSNEVIFGTNEGKFTVVRVDYRPTFPERGGREVVSSFTTLPLLPLGNEGHPLVDVAYGDSGTQKMAAGVQIIEGKPHLFVETLAQRRTLMGAGPISVDKKYDLTHLLQGAPVRVLIPWEANSVLVLTDDGVVNYLFYANNEFYLRQTFQPFEDLPDPQVVSMDFLLGDVSIVFTSQQGHMRVWSLFRDPETDSRQFGWAKTFENMEAGADYFSMSLRNKAFLTGHDDFVTLRYMTTEKVRWEERLPFTPRMALLGPRYNSILFLDPANNLHLYDLYDPHPMSGWKTYFGKIRYEGQSEASYEWQSTGGRDDFERKLSLVPLIIGTLKGTLYAMIFAVPIALLGAIYTSQFLRPGLKRYIKPSMEIMASLPSVVLGFLAALWLAPIVSNAVPAVLCAIMAITLAAVGLGWGYSALPNQYRLRIPTGLEFAFILPFFFLSAWAGWNFGNWMESIFFVVTDPNTGLSVADFRLWYPNAIGLSFEQRNAFVVGFVMGFAVIPIVFTISEDSLSNVPEAFRSGSLALGASRWQTAIRIVLPTASPGIFSALMIGLGRAVGETMIVVMATGNAPVTELNPFSGMRTLSANIAVELPEAPYLGTLYRTLFLSAMVLFLMTFLVNTLAEVLRQRLRNRYRAVE